MKAASVVGIVAVLGVTFLSGCGGGSAAQCPWQQDRVEPPRQCSLSAARQGDTLLVEFEVVDLPRAAKTLAVGLKLPDGTVLRPAEIGVLPSPSGELGAAPVTTFQMPRPAGRPAATDGKWLRLQMRYSLPRRSGTAVPSVFTLALGQPDSEFSMARGVTTCVSTRDGSPFLMDPQVTLEMPATADDMPALLPARVFVPSVSFRLDASPSGPAGSTHPMMVVIEPRGPAGDEPVVSAATPAVR